MLKYVFIISSLLFNGASSFAVEECPKGFMGKWIGNDTYKTSLDFKLLSCFEFTLTEELFTEQGPQSQTYHYFIDNKFHFLRKFKGLDGVAYVENVRASYSPTTTLTIEIEVLNETLGTRESLYVDRYYVYRDIIRFRSGFRNGRIATNIFNLEPRKYKRAEQN